MLRHELGEENLSRFDEVLELQTYETARNSLAC